MGIQRLADVMRRGRLHEVVWHVERRSDYDDDVDIIIDGIIFLYFKL